MNTTGYFFHADCRKHEMGPGHPECPERLDAIEDHLLASGVADALDRREAPQAPITDIELAHGRMHVASLRGLTDGLREEINAGGPTHAQLDPDTSINVHTWDAALRAAGAAIAATDAVILVEPERPKETPLESLNAIVPDVAVCVPPASAPTLPVAVAPAPTDAVIVCPFRPNETPFALENSTVPDVAVAPAPAMPLGAVDCE